MHVLLVHCHPVPESYNAALRDAVLRGLGAGGHDVDVVDLHAEGFEPAMTADERRLYHTEGSNVVSVADQLERLKRADALVFVYPTWWYGPPAMLKGWLDRVLLPHETFGLPVKRRSFDRRLTNIRMIAAVTTLGSPWWWWLWIGQPGRRIMLDGLAGIIHPRARKLWLALYAIDRSDEAGRRAFLSRVEARFAGL